MISRMARYVGLHHRKVPRERDRILSKAETTETKCLPQHSQRWKRRLESRSPVRLFRVISRDGGGFEGGSLVGPNGRHKQ